MHSGQGNDTRVSAEKKFASSATANNVPKAVLAHVQPSPGLLPSFWTSFAVSWAAVCCLRPWSEFGECRRSQRKPKVAFLCVLYCAASWLRTRISSSLRRRQDSNLRVRGVATHCGTSRKKAKTVPALWSLLHTLISLLRHCINIPPASFECP